MLFSEYNFFKINLIDPASPLMFGIIELHDHIFFFLNMIAFLVLYLIASTLRKFVFSTNTKRNRYVLYHAVKPKWDWLRLNHGVKIEILWTVLPSLVLLFIAIPSFALLYATDELVDPSVTVQVIAHQWYWSYEYNDLSFASKTTQLNYEKLVYSCINTNFRHYYLNEILNDKLLYNFYIGLDRISNVSWFREVPHEFSPTFLKSFKADSYLSFSDFIKEGITFVKKFSSISPPYRCDLLVELSKSNRYTWPPSSFFFIEYKNSSGSIQFDSYLKEESDLALGEPRLYETDMPLILPKFTHIRFMITSEDVLHSWSVPALGIKVDAVPGRINHAHTYIKRSGTFYGQCSELCGVNHGFMPIQVIAFEPHMYYNYLRLTLLNK